MSARRPEPREPSRDSGQLGLFGGAERATGEPRQPAAGRRSGEEPAGTGEKRAPDGLATDRHARETAQSEFVRPLLVEAGAGTGKTTTLTARILAWSLGPGWDRAAERVREREARRHPLAAPSDQGPPDPDAVAAETLSRVVAITFTEAAAAEMARRVGEALTRLSRSHLPGRLSRPDPAEAPGGPEERDEAANPPLPGLRTETLPPEPERSLRARALLGGLDHLVVRTIHAFCRSLLAAHPLEAGLHPDLEVDADGSAVEEIAREVVEDHLAPGYGEPGDPDLIHLAGHGIGPAELVEGAAELIRRGVRAGDLDASPFGPERLRELQEALGRECRELEAAAGGRLEGAGRSRKSLETLESLRRTARACAEASVPEPGVDPRDTVRAFAALCTAVAGAWEGTRDRLGKWSRGELNQTEAGALGEAAPAVTEAAAALLARVDHLRALDPELLEGSRRALAPMVAAVRREMRRRGVVTFFDLLAEARDLLTRSPGVARRVRRRIDQLLVDELQDTDRLQCAVVAVLGLDGPPEERPGLFLVGDPKQSIYGWRNADLRAYEELRRRVEAAGGERLALVQNFRSVPAILDEVERVMAPVMTERPGLQPRFEALVPCPELAGLPGFAREPRAPVEYWVSWRAEDDPDAASGGGSTRGPAGRRAGSLSGTRSGDATLLEADAIARDLAHLHRDEGVPWGHAALLLRSFSDLDDYLEALRRHDVPFAVTGDRQYYRRREVIDAAALVRAVLDPGDHLALLTVLRSPAVGVPDAALVPLWLEDLPRRATELDAPDPEALEELRQAVERAVARMPPAAEVPGLDRVTGWERVLLATLEGLAHARHSFATEPADRFIEALRRLVPLEPVAAARYLGRYRLANLDRFYRRLVDAMERSAGDTTAILRALRRGVAEALDEEEGHLQGAAEDAVQVMTVHKAKGLDFAHVYLPQMHKTSPRERLPRFGLGTRPGSEALEYCLFGAPTPGYAAVAQEARRVEDAERVRTLYVATTRAEERLVLLGGWPDAPSRGEPDGARCYLDLLAARFPALDSVEALWAEAAEAGGRLDRHGVRWVFPAFEPAEAAETAPEASPPGGSAAEEGAAGAPPSPEAPPAIPDPEAVAAEARELEAHRAAARVRMDRPLAGWVSREAHARLEALEEEGADPAGGRSADPGEPGPLEGTPGPRGSGRDGGPSDRRAPDEEPELREARELAQAAGTAVHRALEELDLSPGSDPAAELAGLRGRIAGLLPPRTPASRREPAATLAGEALDRLLAGPLVVRLAALRGRVLARELPVLLPPGGEEGTGAVGFVSGAVDLVYRDPATDEPVVADFKTDRVETPDALTARADAYALQARAYARALQEALGLPTLPRAELWFLWPGEVVEVPPDPD